MRMVVALCEVEYRGRLTTTLPAAVRLIMLKQDTVAIHAESSGIKPLNWMVKAPLMEMPDYRDKSGPTTWVFASNRESLEIRLLSVQSDTTLQLAAEEPGLVKIGTEAQLQEWLAEEPEVLADGLRLIGREYPTGHGPVDLLCEDVNGDWVAVEIKRQASIGAVDQVSRYVAALEPEARLAGVGVRGLIAALQVRPRARTLAEKRGFNWVEFNYPED